MPWTTNGGPHSGPLAFPNNPWGNPPPPGNGGGPRTPPPGGEGRGPGNGGRGPGGGWPPGGGGQQGPDLDALIAAAQAWLRKLLPPAGGSGGGLGGGFGGGSSGGGRFGALFNGGNGRLLGLGALALVALWLATGIYRVQPDELGVVLRFGAFTRATPPGLNYHLPWPIEQVALPAVTRINRTDVGYRSDQFVPGTGASLDPKTREMPAESLMLTGDENIIDINFAVFWKIRDVGDFLFNTRNPTLTVKSAAESVMREVIGSTPIQPALTEARARIETGVLARTQAILDQYKAGVEITQVQLQRVDPPAAVIDSFRDVQRANTDADRLRNEAESYRNDIIPRARGEAARLVAEAEGARQAAIAEATGQAQRFNSVLTAYQAAKDVTLKRLYIESMEDLLSHNPATVVDPSLRGILPLLPTGPVPVAAVSPDAQQPPPMAPPPPPQPSLRSIPR